MPRKMYIGDVDNLARKINKMYVGVKNLEKAELPSGYVELYYIESSGTQYIDTGFTPDSNTSVVIDAQLTYVPSTEIESNLSLFGTRNENEGVLFLFYRSSMATFRLSTGSFNNYASIATDAGARHVFQADNNVLTIDGTSLSNSDTSFEATFPLFVFACNNSGTPQYYSSMRLYRMYIYDSGVLVRNFIPCTNPSGEAGLYDLVNSQFYGNSGTGTFAIGAPTPKNVARRVKKGYVGIGGLARPFWGGGKPVYYGRLDSLGITTTYLASTTVGDYALFGGGLTTEATVDTVTAYNKYLVKSTPTALSIARRYLTATTVGEYAMFAGGQDNNGSVRNTVDVYNRSLTRSACSGLSKVSNALKSTSLGDYAFFGGGTNGNSAITIVNVYNKSLTKMTDLVLQSGRYHCSAISIGNYAIFAGGQYSTSSYRSHVDAFDTSLVRTIAESLSNGKGELASAIAGKHALFGGGVDSGLSAIVDAYDTSLTRSSPTALSVARSALAATEVGDYALFGGGNSSGGAVATVDSYDESLVHEIQTDLCRARHRLAATTLNEYAIFGGGSGGIVEAFSILE